MREEKGEGGERIAKILITETKVKVKVGGGVWVRLSVNKCSITTGILSLIQALIPAQSRYLKHEHTITGRCMTILNLATVICVDNRICSTFGMLFSAYPITFYWIRISDNRYSGRMGLFLPFLLVYDEEY